MDDYVATLDEQIREVMGKIATKTPSSDEWRKLWCEYDHLNVQRNIALRVQAEKWSPQVLNYTRNPACKRK